MTETESTAALCFFNIIKESDIIYHRGDYMLFDVYMIFVTAFALFGMYCLAEQILMALKYSSSPKTVTLIKYDASYRTYDAIRFIHNSLYNNDIVVLSDNPDNKCPMATTVTPGELSQYITNALFTKPYN